MLSCVRKIYIDCNLRKVVAEHINYKMPDTELYAYVKILLQFGKKVRLKNLLSPPSRTDLTEINRDVESLVDIYINGIELYRQKR